MEYDKKDWKNEGSIKLTDEEKKELANEKPSKKKPSSKK